MSVGQWDCEVRLVDNGPYAPISEENGKFAAPAIVNAYGEVGSFWNLTPSPLAVPPSPGVLSFDITLDPLLFVFDGVVKDPKYWIYLWPPSGWWLDADSDWWLQSSGMTRALTVTLPEGAEVGKVEIFVRKDQYT